jgi:3-oxoacyl-[acyl-carrier-protein] synthase II
VVTGLGTLGSCGAGPLALSRALASGVGSFKPIDHALLQRGVAGARTASLVGDLDLSAWVAPSAARRMSTPSRFAVAASQMALRQSGAPTESLASTAVVLSTAFGPSSFTERLLRSLETEGPESASPFLFAECVANAPAAQVAISCAATGPNITIVQREAGPLLAVGRGAGEVASGRAARALVGAVDEMPPLALAVLDRFGALARASGRGGEIARPFDLWRHGFVAAEGATVVVLEEEGAARRRGADVLSRVRAWGSAFDPTASRVGWGKGHESLGQSIGSGLERARLLPRDIDRIVSGASGSKGGDRLEGLTLRELWRAAPLPVIVAPKGVTGEYGGGFLAAAFLAAQATCLGPTAGFEEPDPEIGITPHLGAPLSLPSRVLVLAMAAGGACAWLVLEKP